MRHQISGTGVPLEGRPNHDKIIQKDEIINLVIDLNLLTVEEFLLKHCTIIKKKMRKISIYS